MVRITGFDPVDEGSNPSGTSHKEDWQSWFIAPVSKTGGPVRVPQVRILYPPQHKVGIWPDEERILKIRKSVRIGLWVRVPLLPQNILVSYSSGLKRLVC